MNRSVEKLRKLIRLEVASLRRRALLSAARAVVHRIVASDAIQKLQVEALSDEVLDNVELFEPFGFTSHARADGATETIIIAIGGNRDLPVAMVVTDREKRPTNLAEGESCQYAIVGGEVKRAVLAKADGEVHLADAPTDYVALAQSVKDELDAIKSDLDTLTVALKIHVHTGVTTGSGSSGYSPAFDAYVPHTPASVAASKVKAQ